ncbi:hypothetical protein LK413_10685 [Prevotella melaninogenica]|uniref:hypothetical protein n=1 Tax=Prevotella melaninogenica TaxID=28132 RepID=UPI001D153DCA|nr:hypothetical protein [Prevotella melaninogenica]UEB00208.1 hypothetical protein LK413_10685 [Prevotella melaninogenica]
MSYLISEYVIDQYITDVEDLKEIVTLLHLFSKSMETTPAAKEVMTQKTRIAFLCGYRNKPKGNTITYVNKIIKGLTEKGYLISTSTDYINIKGVNKTTTKWVLSDKSMSIIKGLNKQSKDKAKATSKIKSLPTQAYQATTKEAKEATKETAPQQEYKPSLAELQAAIKI